MTTKIRKINIDMVAKKLYRSNINLVIVGLGLHQTVIPKLKALCNATSEGVFIESPETEDLDVAFQAMSDIIYGQDLIIETISL